MNPGWPHPLRHVSCPKNIAFRDIDWARKAVWPGPAKGRLRPRRPHSAPPELAPRPRGNRSTGRAVEHGRGEEAGRRIVAQAQVRNIRPTATLVTAEHVAH